MIKQLAHICILSEDLDKTLDFYCGALGFDRHFDFHKDGALFGFYLKAGSNTFIEVFKGKPGAPGNIGHVALEVEDMDGMIERVKEHGYGIGQKKLGADQSWQVWLEDPSGVKIELHEYTSESSQLTRRNCIANW